MIGILNKTNNSPIVCYPSFIHISLSVQFFTRHHLHFLLSFLPSFSFSFSHLCPIPTSLSSLQTHFNKFELITTAPTWATNLAHPHLSANPSAPINPRILRLSTLSLVHALRQRTLCPQSQPPSLSHCCKTTYRTFGKWSTLPLATTYVRAPALHRQRAPVLEQTVWIPGTDHSSAFL